MFVGGVGGGIGGLGFGLSRVGVLFMGVLLFLVLEGDFVVSKYVIYVV